MADNAVIKCEEKRVLNKGDFDLHILLNVEHFCQEVNAFWHSIVDIFIRQLGRQTEEKYGNIDHILTEDIIDDFLDAVFNKFDDSIYQILHLVNDDPFKLLNIDEWENAEAFDEKRNTKNQIKQMVMDSFEFFQRRIEAAFTEFHLQFKKLYDKDAQHYQNTIDKIDDFIAFIKQNEKNRKLNLKEKA